MLQAQESIDREKVVAARKRVQREAKAVSMGIDPSDASPEVEVHTDAEARKIADNPIPNIPDDWKDWERDALDPTRDLQDG